jgi:hypothetical protein
MNYLLLTYSNKPIGIYSKMNFIFDYLLELSSLPNYQVNFNQIKIFEYQVNHGYPVNVFSFTTNQKLVFVEESGKRVEMNKDTFSRFLKLSKFLTVKSNVILNKPEIKTETKEKPKLEDKSNLELTHEELLKIKEIEENKNQVRKEYRDTIEELNRMKWRNKKIQNWSNQYQSDLNLFRRLLEEKKETEKNEEEFIIPKLFKEKYQFFEDCEDINQDNFENYFREFNTDAELDFKEIEEFLYQESSSDED